MATAKKAEEVPGSLIYKRKGSGQVFKDPLKNVPVNASRRKIVDKTQELLMFSYWHNYLASNTSLPDHIQKKLILPPMEIKPEEPPCSALKIDSHTGSFNSSNTIFSFHTMSKPTCGYRYTRETDHKKRLIGVLPSNVVRWRPSELERNTKLTKILMVPLCFCSPQPEVDLCSIGV
ncbi:putative uncharacterized protein GUCA1ANB [Protopterus annectens]|uniref:putative uncharacterized protein GUCA1ANB n=1 Tax=Protopterus annectens TaxID=7888 RepID=UPI001CFBD2D0|nr:putative uncharacterized protein GUCA1ANB [Protopterus annectens]